MPSIFALQCFDLGADLPIEKFVHLWDPAFGQDVQYETIHLQPAGIFKVDSPLAHIIDRFGIELTDRRSMAALHIIGIDLQLRFGVGMRLIPQQEVVILLEGLRPLGVLCDIDPTTEDRSTTICSHPFKQLIAVAV